MPASETQQEEGRRGGRPLTVVFWIGVGLAPLAALLLLVGGASGSKVAAVLAILAVVLVGLSVMLKPDASSVRVELEETMLDEIDMLREDVRQDITTAARATHKSFSEKLQVLHENVEALRGQVESVRAAGQERDEPRAAAAPARPAPPPAPEPQPQSSPPIVAGGVVRHTETVRETTRQTIVDQHGDADRGTVYGGGNTYGRQAEPATPPPVHRRGDRSERDSERGRSDRDGWGSGRDDREESWTEQKLRERLAEERGGRGEPRSDDHRGGHRGGDSRGGDFRGGESRGDSYGGGHRGGGHYRDDDYPSGDVRGRDEYPSGDVRGEDSWRPRRHDRDDPADDPRWSDVRAGDRWAAVRSDDRGRELRMGERRAEMHSDESGTELRIEDRWASVREEEGRRSEGRRSEGRRSEDRRSEDRRADYSRDAGDSRSSRHESRSRDDSRDEPRETRRERREREERWSSEPSEENRPAGRRARADDDDSDASWRRHGSAPALPPGNGPSASSWTQGWSEEPEEREREPRRRRGDDRDDRWERGQGPSRGGGRSHRLDFELSDDRWR